MNKLSGPCTLLAERLAATPEAIRIVRDATTVAEAVERLCLDGQRIAAVRLVAHALPPREAVWWACMCADHTAPPYLADADRAARHAAEQWVRRSADDTCRRAAMQAAQKAGMQTPEAWAGVSAFWSGGSMTPQGQPEIPPALHLCGTAVAGSVLLASVREHPSHQPDRLSRFLDSAKDIARGGAGRLPSERI